VATYFRRNPPQTPEQRQEYIDYYAQIGREGLRDQDFEIGNTLQLNASTLNSLVRSGIGNTEAKEWDAQGRPTRMGPWNLEVTTDLDFSPVEGMPHGKNGQLLHTWLSIPDPEDPNQVKPYKAQEGDVLLLMSDGPADVLNKQQIASTLGEETDVGKMSTRFQHIVEMFLDHYKQFSLEAGPGERKPLPRGGFIDMYGNVYNSSDPDDTHIEAHFGPDNITALFLKIGPRNEPPKGPTPPPPPPPAPPKVDPKASTPPEGISAADVDDDSATTGQFQRSALGVEDVDPETPTQQIPPKKKASSNPPPPPSGPRPPAPPPFTSEPGVESPLVSDPDLTLSLSSEPQTPAITLVGGGLDLRAQEILIALREKWLSTSLKDSDQFILINLAYMGAREGKPEGLAFDNGKVVKEPNQCMENQILLQVKRDPITQERSLQIVDSSLGLLAGALKMDSEGIQKLLDKVFSPPEVIEAAPDSEPEPIEAKDENSNTTQNMGRERGFVILIQDQIIPTYVAALKEGKVQHGRIRVYKGPDNFVFRWESEGSDPLPIPQGWKGPLAQIRFKGNIVTEDDAYSVIPVGNAAAAEKENYQRFLSDIKSAMTTVKKLVRSSLEHNK